MRTDSCPTDGCYCAGSPKWHLTLAGELGEGGGVHVSFSKAGHFVKDGGGFSRVNCS